MSRWLAAVALVVAGCHKKQETQPAPPEREKVEAPPVGPVTKAPDDPAYHLKPEEGTLTITRAEGKAGSEAVASIRVTPGEGFHMSTIFPTKIKLEPPTGVNLAKAELTAGTNKQLQGDAQTLSEKLLAFDVKATVAKPGTYDVIGMFRFGVCEHDNCREKRQPITIQVVAN